jgi:hypothetical protein
MEIIYIVLNKVPWIYLWPVLLSVIIIRLFYLAFRNTWPEFYFAVSDYTSLFISVSPIRYFSFTLLPTIIISSFILSFFQRYFQIKNLELIGLSIGLIHSLVTNGIAFWKLLTKNKSVTTFFNLNFQMAMHVFTIVMITLCGYLGGYLGKQKFLIPFIPTWAVIDNIWAALFSSILTVFFYKIYRNEYISEDIIIEKSKNSLTAELVQHLNSTCVKFHAKKDIVMAVCITENIQRPLWVRKLEMIKSIFFKSGTYGIMQVQSKKYINDFESLDLAVEKHFKDTETIVSDDELTSLFSKYNNDSKFLHFVTASYYYLQPRG